MAWGHRRYPWAPLQVTAAAAGLQLRAQAQAPRAAARVPPGDAPTKSSTNSDADIAMNGTPASPATALASSVFPVPGGPLSSTPLGMRARTRA